MTCLHCGGQAAIVCVFLIIKFIEFIFRWCYIYFRLRCEDIRIKIIDYNRKHISKVHEQQMKEKLALQESEKERENMYSKMMLKDIEAMVIIT